MDNSPRVTIIVPVYNVSPHIEQCAESLFEQTYQNIEYIFVNDCTTDDSFKILKSVIERYADKKHQITLIEQSENQGLALTRRKGLEFATGDYILNIDSDDYVELNMVKELVTVAEKEDADLVVCDFFREFTNKTTVIHDTIDESGKVNMKGLILNGDVHPCVWNKLIKKEIITNKLCAITERIDYGEDRFLSIRLYYLSKKICKVNLPLYHYRAGNPTSITKRRDERRFKDTLCFWNQLDIFLKQVSLYDTYKQMSDLSRVKDKVRLMFDTDRKELRKKYADIFSDETKQYFRHLTFTEKVMLVLINNRLYNLSQLLRWIVKWKKDFEKNLI